MPNEFIPSDAELQHLISQFEAKAAEHQAKANKYSEMAKGASDQKRQALIAKAKEEYEHAKSARNKANVLRSLLKQRQDQQRQKAHEQAKKIQIQKQLQKQYDVAKDINLGTTKRLQIEKDYQIHSVSQTVLEARKAREEAARQKTLEEQRQKQMQEVARNAASLSQQPMTQLPSNQRTQG